MLAGSRGEFPDTRTDQNENGPLAWVRITAVPGDSADPRGGDIRMARLGGPDMVRVTRTNERATGKGPETDNRGDE